MALSLHPPRRSPSPFAGVAAALVSGSRALSLLILGLAAAGCGEPVLEPAPPSPKSVIPGMPRIREEPRWRLGDGADGSDSLQRSRPRICETFVHGDRVRAVDFLLVIDLGRSMSLAGDGVLQRIQQLLDVLYVAPRFDFQVGILAGSATEQSQRLGRLEPIAGARVPYVHCEPSGACNVEGGTWEEARRSLLAAVRDLDPGPVGLGLLAAAQAIGVQADANEGFLRESADLHVFVVSDVDDASCNPRTTPGGSPCSTFGACGCEEEPEFGDAAYFIRLLRGMKGYGFEERVKLSAMVATAARPLRMAGGSLPLAGCSTSPDEVCASPWSPGVGVGCALHAPRYAEVARATGGEILDLCSPGEGPSNLGALVSGLAKEFPLERKPLPASIEAVLLSNPEKSCDHLDPCPESGLDCIRGRCGQVVLEGGTNGWRYVSCSNGIPRNMIRIGDRSDPRQHQKFEVCYDVDVGADFSPCP